MKKKSGISKIVIFLVLVVPAVYIGVQLFAIVNRPYKTQTAVAYQMSDSVSCEGILGMEETLVTYDGTGVVGYLAQNGERVLQGSSVVQIFDQAAQAQNSALATRLTNEIELLQKSQTTATTSADVELLFRQIQAGIYTMLDVVDSGDYAQLYAVKEQLQLAENKLQLATGKVTDFNQRIAQLSAQRDAALAAASTRPPVVAPATGYFVSAQDSGKRLYSMQQLTEMSPEEFSAALQRPVPENDATTAGKIISDYTWRYFALVTKKEAQKFVEGAFVELSFPGVSNEALPAQVVTVQIDEAAEIAKVELVCHYINENVITLQKENALITFKNYKGIRIDQRALHIVEGETIVYIKYGSMCYAKRVTPIFEDENYFLVPLTQTEGENEIALFDEIIVEGTDLYHEKTL